MYQVHRLDLTTLSTIGILAIHLGFFSSCGEDDSARLRRLRSAQFVNESSDALVSGAEAVVRYQILPDGSGIATTAQT